MNQKSVKMNKSFFVPLILFVGIVILQFLPFVKADPIESVPAKPLAGVPEEINAILEKSCFDCHSSQSNLSWYDKIVPLDYFVNGHIEKGRAALDFSKWDSLGNPARNNLLYYSLNKILEGEMPLKSYSYIHGDNKPSENDIALLKSYLKERTPRKAFDPSQGVDSNKTLISLKKEEKIVVAPNANGIEYIPDYKDWKLISFSDRFDNGTMRLIYANDIAVKAIQDNKVKPWPDGAIFAKAAWKSKTNSDGTLSSGEFFQVEFMIKDAQKFKNSLGWGWARWRGKDLKPYGGEAILTTECTNCHKPLKESDYVFTRPFLLTNLK